MNIDDIIIFIPLLHGNLVVTKLLASPFPFNGVTPTMWRNYIFSFVSYWRVYAFWYLEAMFPGCSFKDCVILSRAFIDNSNRAFIIFSAGRFCIVLSR